jgi:hypothetical protein
VSFGDTMTRSLSLVYTKTQGMKKAMFVCLVMLSTAISVVAQEGVVEKTNADGFFGRLDIGYTMPHAANYYYSNGFSSTPMSGSRSFVPATGARTVDLGKASFSSGANVNIGGGYMWNRYIGLDLGIRVGVVPKRNTHTFNETDPSGTIGLERISRSYSKASLYIIPSLLLSTGNDAPFNAYIRAGIGLQAGGKIIETYTETDYISNDVYEEVAEYDLYRSKALCGALGFNCRVWDNVSLYGEVNGMSLTNYAKRRTVTSAILNGTDQLPARTIAQQETEYHSNDTYDPATQSATMPSRQPAASMPGSNIGVSLGAHIGLGPHHPTKTDATNETPDGYVRIGVDLSQTHSGNYFLTDGFSSRPVSGTESYNTVTGVTTTDLNKISYGSGFGITVGGGYMFTPHLGVDLNMNIGVAAKNYKYAYKEVGPGGASTLDDVYTSYFATPVLVTPSIVVCTGSNDPFNVYARAGIVFPVSGRLVTRTEFTTASSATVISGEYKFGMSKGLMGTIGVQRTINSYFSLFGELSGMSLTRYAKSSEITAYTINGEDQLPFLTTYQRRSQYGSSHTVTPPAGINSPAQLSPFSLPYSRWTAQLGARFQFR